jgi:hypothetical protein
MKEPKQISDRLEGLEKRKKEFEKDVVVDRQALSILKERIRMLKWVLN